MNAWLVKRFRLPDKYWTRRRCHEKHLESARPKLGSISVYSPQDAQNVTKYMRDSGLLKSRACDYAPGRHDAEMTQLQLKLQSIERDLTP